MEHRVYDTMNVKVKRLCVYPSLSARLLKKLPMNLYETYETVHTAKLESDQRTVVMVTQIQEFSKADYVERLTGMKTDKLMEVSQGSEA